MRLRHWLFITLIFFAASVPATADIGLLLNAKPNGHVEIGFAEITGAGHSAVYLSRVCPESPIKLRLCRPGELGSVIQNYENYREDEPYEWNVVPLSDYLYGVDDGRVRRVGLSAENILSAESDHRLAMQVLLARTSALLSANAKHRELWPDFQTDWALLERAERVSMMPRGGAKIATRIGRP